MLKRSLQYLALFLLLIVLPAGSWYYLSKGMDYRLQTTRELGDFGQVPNPPYMLFGEKVLTPDALRDHVLVVMDLSDVDGVHADRVLTEFGKIHEQFDAREDVLFMVLAMPGDSARLEPLLSKNGLSDPAQVYLLKQDTLGTPDFKFDQVDKEHSNAYVALVDTAGQIRQYYDFRAGSRVKRIVEHIAMLMPVLEREQAILKREKEM